MPECFSAEPAWCFNSAISDEAAMRDAGEVSTSHALCCLWIRPLLS